MDNRPILIDLPTPILTPRLMLREPRPGDGPELNAAILESLNELKPWMPWARGEIPTVADSEANVREAYANWILREDLRFTVFDRVTGRMVASSGLHRIKWQIPTFEIGYWCRTSASGNGYVTEAVIALTRYSIEYLSAKRVELKCNATNEKSKKIIEKLGFILEGRLREDDHCADESIPVRDTLVYSRIDLKGLPPLDVKW